MGESSSHQEEKSRTVVFTEDPYEQDFDDVPHQESLSRGSKKSLGDGLLVEEDRECLSPSERLRRARAGKKKVTFVKLDGEVDSILPESHLSSEGESFSENAPPITDDDPPLSEDVGFEASKASDF